MAIYYASVGYVSDPENLQTIPAGETRPLKFPITEQRDPWNMHPDPGALFRSFARGLATVQLDVTWTNGGTFTRRLAVVSENQDYENNWHTRLDVDSWTSLLVLKPGEEFAVLVSHDSPSPQDIQSARIQIVIQDDVAERPERRIRVRAGTDPSVPDDPEAPANPGDDGTPPVDWPE